MAAVAARHARTDSAVPAVLDANTAMYSLHKGLGDTIDLTDERGQAYPGADRRPAQEQHPARGRDCRPSEEFLRLYPGVSGQRMFLIETSLADMAAVEQALEVSLGDFGFDAERSADRLAAFMAVQNTYLSTFQSLGGLGLLLGTFGLATVQLRNVLERRGELALLRAAGFRQARLALLVMLENAALLLAGLGHRHPRRAGGHPAALARRAGPRSPGSRSAITLGPGARRRPGRRHVRRARHAARSAAAGTAGRMRAVGQTFLSAIYERRQTRMSAPRD